MKTNEQLLVWMSIIFGEFFSWNLCWWRLYLLNALKTCLQELLNKSRASVSEAFLSLQKMRLYTIDQYKLLLVSEVVNNCLGGVHYRHYSLKMMLQYLLGYGFCCGSFSVVWNHCFSFIPDNICMMMMQCWQFKISTVEFIKCAAAHYLEVNRGHK